MVSLQKISHQENMYKSTWLNALKPKKTTISSTLLIRYRVKGYCCEWDIPYLHRGSLESTRKVPLKGL